MDGKRVKTLQGNIDRQGFSSAITALHQDFMALSPDQDARFKHVRLLDQMSPSIFLNRRLSIGHTHIVGSKL